MLRRLLNGQPAEHIHLADRGLQYGDGVFRTIKVVAGQPCWWAEQMAKLAADAACLGIACPPASLLRAELQQLLAEGPQDATAKIILTRGESARGYAAPADLTPNRIVQLGPLPSYPAEYAQVGVAVRSCTTRASWQPALAGIKHLNRLESVLARREWQDPAIYEGLLFDREDLLIEGVMSNVWVLLDGVLCTPRLDSAGVAGVARAQSWRAATELGWPVSERPISRAELAGLQGLWLCNSLSGLLPVASWDGQPLPRPALTAEWQAALARLP
ncbi:aminodeoxychorismate lyase [Chitinibacter tainanensis]|uniref:aminodeoxychorismate lyase n=1 Tax=Chitinibacter tainanensis TaxID=230667 RepID=UPI000426D787|nr:aminodeoxychorismate lyase [Chitinibacter tainanensis]